MADLKMRLSDEDERKLAECEAWYDGVSRAGVVRLALIELHRYVVGARRRKEDAAILAAHRPSASVLPVVAPAQAAPAREWNKRMDEIIQERKRDGLPMLQYEALLAASKRPVEPPE